MDDLLVRELLHYDPDTGAVTWKERSRELFNRDTTFKMWNKRYAGELAGTVFLNRGKPYLAITYLGKRYLLHRLIWVYLTGYFPTGEIDHINGDGTDNRRCNLREVNHAENSKNQKVRCNNRYGIPGVRFDKRRGRWCAEIRVNYDRKFLGYFETVFDAACARKSSENIYNFHENHGRIV